MSARRQWEIIPVRGGRAGVKGNCEVMLAYGWLIRMTEGRLGFFRLAFSPKASSCLYMYFSPRKGPWVGVSTIAC